MLALHILNRLVRFWKTLTLSQPVHTLSAHLSSASTLFRAMSDLTGSLRAPVLDASTDFSKSISVVVPFQPPHIATTPEWITLLSRADLETHGMPRTIYVTVKPALKPWAFVDVISFLWVFVAVLAVGLPVLYSRRKDRGVALLATSSDINVSSSAKANSRALDICAPLLDGLSSVGNLLAAARCLDSGTPEHTSSLASTASSGTQCDAPAVPAGHGTDAPPLLAFVPNVPTLALLPSTRTSGPILEPASKDTAIAIGTPPNGDVNAIDSLIPKGAPADLPPFPELRMSSAPCLSRFRPPPSRIPHLRTPFAKPSPCQSELPHSTTPARPSQRGSELLGKGMDWRCRPADDSASMSAAAFSASRGGDGGRMRGWRAKDGRGGAPDRANSGRPGTGRGWDGAVVSRWVPRPGRWSSLESGERPSQPGQHPSERMGPLRAAGVSDVVLGTSLMSPLA